MYSIFCQNIEYINRDKCLYLYFKHTHSSLGSMIIYNIKTKILKRNFFKISQVSIEFHENLSIFVDIKEFQVFYIYLKNKYTIEKTQ